MHNRWKRMSETEKLEYVSLSIVTKSHTVHLIFFFCHQCEEINSLWIFLLQPSTIQHLSLMSADWCDSDNTESAQYHLKGLFGKGRGMEISTFLRRKPKQVMWGSIFSGGFDFTVSALKHFGHYNFSLVLLVLIDPSWLCHFRSPAQWVSMLGIFPCLSIFTLCHSPTFSALVFWTQEWTLDFASQ